MPKYKYEVYDHFSGRVMRGDRVAAFIPRDDKGRRVQQAEVVGISRNSIRVKYFFKGAFYEATLKDHQWCFIKTCEEDIYNNKYVSELQADRAKLERLMGNPLMKEAWDNGN